MKTIESCEMSSSPSPPRLEDPDLIKISNNETEKTVEKNGFKEDKITKDDKVNGCSSDSEEKQESQTNSTHPWASMTKMKPVNDSLTN